IFAKLAEHRREHFRRAAWQSASSKNPFYFRDYRVFIAVEMSADAPMVVDQLTEARDKFQSDLMAMQDIESFVMRPKDLIQAVGDMLNPSPNIRAREAHYEPDLWINNQIVDGETRYTIYRD